MKILPLAIFGLIGFSLWKKAQAANTALDTAAAAAQAEADAEAAVAAAAQAAYQKRGAQAGWSIADVVGNTVLWQNVDGRKYFYTMNGAQVAAEGSGWPA